VPSVVLLSLTVGLAFNPQQIPLAVMALPPSAAAFPSMIAVVPVAEITVVVTVARDIAVVLNITSLP
jgi:hypothetical protein